MQSKSSPTVRIGVCPSMNVLRSGHGTASPVRPVVGSKYIHTTWRGEMTPTTDTTLLADREGCEVISIHLDGPHGPEVWLDTGEIVTFTTPDHYYRSVTFNPMWTSESTSEYTGLTPDRTA